MLFEVFNTLALLQCDTKPKLTKCIKCIKTWTLVWTLVQTFRGENALIVGCWTNLRQTVIPDYLNVEQAFSLAAGSAEANQLEQYLICYDLIASRLHVKNVSACTLLSRSIKHQNRIIWLISKRKKSELEVIFVMYECVSYYINVLFW